MADISILLKLIGDYAPTITGLNQGFELVGKTINYVGNAANLIFTAMKSGIEDVAKGGTFAESTRQMNNVAESYGRNADQISDSLDSITGNILKLEDRTKLVGKAITSNLSEDQIGTVFTFLKRRTELTGESFTALSEQVFKALSSGETSVLKQFGLVISTGDNVSSLVSKMAAATQAYGNAGYNAADSLDALQAQQSNLMTQIGAAINDVPLLQSVLQTLVDGAVGIVNLLDPRPITAFFDVFSEMAFDAAKSILSAVPFFGEAFDAISEIASGGGQSFAAFAQTASGFLFDLVRAAGDTYNTLVDMGLVDLVGTIISTTIEIVRIGTLSVVSILGELTSRVLDGIGVITGLLSQFIASSPRIAEYIGISADDVQKIELGFKRAGKAVDGMTTGFLSGLDKAADFGQRINGEIADALTRTRFDSSSIDDYEQKLQDKISNIDFSKSWETALGTGLKDGSFSAINAIDEKIRQKAEASAAKASNAASAQVAKKVEASAINSISSNVTTTQASSASAGNIIGNLGESALSSFADALNKQSFDGFGLVNAIKAETTNQITNETINKALNVAPQKTESESTISESAILSALVKILKQALTAEAIAENMPMVILS